MKRKTKSTRGPIEYCKLIFWTISTLKVVCSFYHVYWHPTLMREYNKMQEKLERAQDQHMEFFYEDLINKEYGKRIEPEFQGNYSLRLWNSDFRICMCVLHIIDIKEW